MKRYFITGTDTDCGKTYTTIQLLNFFPTAQAIKPVASGCIERDGVLASTDALAIQKHCSLTLDQINPWRFKPAIAPHLAAIEAGVDLSAQLVADYCLNNDFNTDLLFIEGAGGLQVPLNYQETWVHFLQQTSIPVIFVVGMKLGCINHALLTANALQAYNLHCAGWIANCIDPQMSHLQENIDTLNQCLDYPCLAQIPHRGVMESCLDLFAP